MLPDTVTPSQARSPKPSVTADQVRETREWTILFYLCGDHGRLSRRIRLNIRDIENFQTSKHMYVAVQHDLAKEGARKFVIADRPVTDDDKIPLEEINTGDPETALTFFRWGLEQCPSRHVAIVIGGAGIAEPQSIVGNVDVAEDYEQLFAFCDDSTAKDALTPMELAEVFAAIVEKRNGEPIDLVAFDMCSMQYLEIAYQFKDLVRVMIGTQNNERAPDWPYAKLLKNCVDLVNTKQQDKHSAAAAMQPDTANRDLMEALQVMGHADPNDPRVLAAVGVKVISDSYQKRHEQLKPIVSALDLTHLDRVTRSLDTLFLALMRSLGNPVIWESRDQAFKKLLENHKNRIEEAPELRNRELIAYDLLEMLSTLSATLNKYIEKGGLAFWFEQQLDRLAKQRPTDLWQQEIGDPKLRAEAQDPDRIDFLNAQIEEWQIEHFSSFKGDKLKFQLDQAFDWLAKTQRDLQKKKKSKPDDFTRERVRILESMWLHYHKLDESQLAENVENARHLKEIIDDVAKLLQPAPRAEATNGKWFVLASEPRRATNAAEQRCGLLIHRPQHLDKLAGSTYLKMDFHNRVHWVSLLGAVNLIRNHPGAMWRLISSLLSTASAAARDDLLRRLIGPDSVVSGFGDQFRALRRPPCVTLSIEKQTQEQMQDSVDARGEAQQSAVKRQGYRLVLDSSRKGATVAEQFNRVNHQTIKSTLDRLEELLKRSWVTKQDLKIFESLGRTLGEDVVQKLNCQLSEERQLVLEENPDDVLHMQLQLPLDLMRYPWELMHDGEGFLGERYALGRQLYMPTGMSKRIPRRKERGIKILIIGDPLLDGANRFQQLIAAREEAKEVADQFVRLGRELRGALDFERERDVYIQETVTTHDFREWLRSGEYDIIHFAGHADYVEGDPERSAWIFSDGPMWAVEIRNTLAQSRTAPWLVFANACESSMGEGRPAGYQSNVYGLATAFINEGVTAFLGPLWPISDAVALQMAKDFYESLLLERATVGEALRFAKVRAKETTQGDLEPTSFFGTHTGLSWASMILYGDPTMKLMDTLGTSVPGRDEAEPSELMKQSQRLESRKLVRRRRYSTSGLRQRPIQSSVADTQNLLLGPGMEAKILNSQQVSKEIPAGKYALELDDVSGVRYWQFFDGDGYRALEGSFIQSQLETNNALREEIGLPQLFQAVPLSPRPIGHWLINLDDGSVFSLVRRYDQTVVRNEQFVRIHSDQSLTRLGKAGLRWVNNAAEGKLKRVLVILHDTLCDTKSVVNALGEQFIRWACRNYGAVIGFDHWTLSKSPAENADLLWDDLLQQLGERTNDKNRIDILAHGRGGLVARALVENKNKEQRDPSHSVRHVVFAGTPNAGTDWVNFNSWGQTADTLVNMAHVDGDGMYGRLSGLYARLASLQHLRRDSAEERPFERQIPGLQAMRPGACREHAQWSANVEYSGIAAVYEPGKQNNVWGIIRQCCLDANHANAIRYEQPNDLMAETSSLWDDEQLRQTRNWQMLILNPDLPEELLKSLGKDDSKPEKDRSLVLGPLQAGIHRTNMLSVDATQTFIKRRLLD